MVPFRLHSSTFCYWAVSVGYHLSFVWHLAAAGRGERRRGKTATSRVVEVVEGSRGQPSVGEGRGASEGRRASIASRVEPQKILPGLWTQMVERIPELHHGGAALHRRRDHLGNCQEDAHLRRTRRLWRHIANGSKDLNGTRKPPLMRRQSTSIQICCASYWDPSALPNYYL